MKTVYKGLVFHVESGVLDEPGGVRARRDVIRHSGSVAVLPVQADDRITLVSQYRCVFRQRILELPAGRIDPGETPLQAARRELREELGLGARHWERLLRILPSPGYLDETVTLFRATRLFPAAGTPDADERITPKTLSLAQAMRQLDLHRIQDAKTVAALLLESRRRARVPSR